MAIAVGRTHKFCLLAGGGQRAAFSPTYFSSPMRLFAHIDLIISLVDLACSEVFVHTSGPKRPLLVKTMHAITFQVYLHRHCAVGIEFLIPKRQQCPRHRE